MNDFFSPMKADTGMSALEKRPSASDGLYRPKVTEAKDKKMGYRATMRFLPNMKKDQTRGEFLIERRMHYVKMANYPELNGYYDSMKNFNEKCELTATYWQLRNSKSVMDNEKAELIPYTTRYYSYVQIIEDEQHPEYNGKIMIFPYGTKIKDKISQEKTGEITGEPCNVFDLVNGKDFVLVIKEIGGYPNYDNSQFRAVSSPLKLNGKHLQTEDADGTLVVAASQRNDVMGFLMSRDHELEDYSPARWSDEQASRVSKIIGILTNNPVVEANNAVAQASFANEDSHTSYANAAPVATSVSRPAVSASAVIDPDSFFDDVI